MNIDDLDRARRLVFKLPGSCIAGSTVVLPPDECNDVDIFVSESVWAHNKHKVFEYIPDLIEQSVESSVHYVEGNHTQICSTWRCGDINIIVTSDHMHIANTAAVRAYSNGLPRWRIRDNRIIVHQMFRSYIACMLDGVSDAHFNRMYAEIYGNPVEWERA